MAEMLPCRSCNINDSIHSKHKGTHKNALVVYRTNTQHTLNAHEHCSYEIPSSSSSSLSSSTPMVVEGNVKRRDVNDDDDFVKSGSAETAAVATVGRGRRTG